MFLWPKLQIHVVTWNVQKGQMCNWFRALLYALLFPLSLFLCLLCEFYGEGGQSRRRWHLGGDCPALLATSSTSASWSGAASLGTSSALPALSPPRVQPALQAGSSGGKQAVESKMLPKSLKGRKNWLTSEERQSWAAVERGLHLFHCLYLGRLGIKQRGRKKCFLRLWELKSKGHQSNRGVKAKFSWQSSLSFKFTENSHPQHLSAY